MLVIQMKGHWIRANRIVREAKPAMSRIERHTHEIFHFLYCMDGAAIACVNGEHLTIRKDDVLLISPHIEHAFYIRDGFLSIEAKFHCDQDLCQLLSREPFLICRNDLTAAQTMRDILDEALKQDMYFEDIINAKLLFLMLAILRRSNAKENTISSDCRYRQLVYNGKDKWLSAVTGYIEDHIGQALSVRSVAMHFGYESGYFSSIFKEKFSYPLSRYIAERKIEAAKEMLTAGRSVTDVSQELGFSSVHHFSKKFKAMVGIPPARFNERVRVQLAVNVSGDQRFPPTGEFEYHTRPWDGENYL